MSKTPVERFEEWSASPEGKAFFQGKCHRYGRKRIEQQYMLMCDWLIDNPKKGDKKNWKIFAGNWIRRWYFQMTIEMEKAMNPATMTRADEERQEKTQRAFVPIGKILKDANT